MNNTERDRFLNEVMGYSYPVICYCKSCAPTDFSTWEGFGKLWEWSRKQEWWLTFDDYACATLEHPTSLINPDRFADEIAYFLDKEQSR